MKENEDWDMVVDAKAKLLRIDFSQIWAYRDLIMLFVKRDLVAHYKQTLLGPLWYFIQPIFTIIIYFFMFGKIANISTGEVPKPLYYMSGLVCWNYFTECLNITSNVFINNANLFGKVYFPRLIVPISSVLSSFIKYFMQFVLFAILWSYYKYSGGAEVLHLTKNIFILPLLILEVALMGLSLGLILSSVTTKYRDLRNLTPYALQFGLYSTPIIYSLDWLKEKIPLFYNISLINPMTGIIEQFKSCFWNTAELPVFMLVYPPVFIVVMFVIALSFFNKVEKTFLDTV